MKKNINSIVAIAELIASLLILGAVYIWAPVCDKLLTLQNGNNIPMKCFHSAKLFVALAIITLVISFVQLIYKSDLRFLHMIALLVAVFLLMNTYTSLIGIGICKSAEMPCNKTALWVRISSIIAGVAAFMGIMFGYGSKNVPS